MIQTRSNDVQAVILAAGYGRRMAPLSDDCHKALLPVGGTTILGRIMDGLMTIDVREVTIATGYRAADVERFVREGYPDVNLRLVRNPRYRETNNIVSLAMALNEMSFDRDIVLIECDLLFDPSLMARLVESPGRNVALVDHYRIGMDGTVVSLKDGFVSGVYTTDAQDADFSYEGKFKTLNIYRFDREFCRKTLRPLLDVYAKDVDPGSYYELVLAMLSNIPAHRINAEVVSGERWVEVDDPNDLSGASFRFEPDRRSAILDRAFGGHWNFDVLDFSYIRNAYFPTGSMLAGMRYALPELVSNYGSSQVVLNEKLGYILECNPDHVQVLHGAAQAFPILGQMLDTSQAATPTPTFGEYARVFPDAEHYADSPGIDTSELERVAARNRVCVIVNANTPTGTVIPSRDVYSLAKGLPETLFWVDESFLAFSGEPSLVELLKDHPLDNVLVLTSLSKSLGTPGLRLGYIYSTNAAIVAKVGQALPVWNLSAPAEFLMELFIKFRGAFARSLERTAEDREVLRADLAELSIFARAHPSGANFLLADLNGGQTAAGVRGWLLERHSIEVKDVTARFPDDVERLRIAVRLPEENATLVEALARFPNGAG